MDNERIKKITEKGVPLLFYAGLTIELLLVLYDYSAIPPLANEGLVYRVPFVLFALKVCFSKYSKKEWLCLALFGIFTAAMYFVTGVNLALRAAVFVAAMRGIDIKAAMKYAFWLLLSGTLLIALLSFLGIGRDIGSTEIYRTEVIETRYSFGFGHPNTFHAMVLILVLLFLYGYYGQLKRLALVGLFAINFGLYLLTDSRTGFAVCTLAIGAAMVYALWPKLKEANWPYYAGALVFLLCLGFSVWAAHYADSELLWQDGSLLYKVDNLITRRIANLYWEGPSNPASLSAWTLFSNPQHFDRIFDMGWVRMFFWFGIVPGIVFAVLHLLLLNECRREKDYLALVLFVTAAVYTVVEAQFISVYLGRNPLLYLFGAYWGSLMRLPARLEKWYSKIMEKASKIKGEKLTAILTTSFFFASLLPTLALSYYARAADDDFSFGAWPRQAWVASGSLIEVLKASARKVASVYESWQGTWFSVFVFSLQPEVFSEKAYFIVTPVIILLWVGVATFVMHYFLVRLAGFGKYSFIIINFAFIWLNMQYIPSPFSSLTWYNGIMHYQFPFLLSIFLLYLLTRYGQDGKHAHLVGCAVIMAVLGGSNYLSALFALLITVLIMAGSYWLKRQKKTLLLLIPIALLLVGLAVSMVAPGNKIRGGADFGFSFARAMRTIGAALVESITGGGGMLAGRPWVIIGLAFILMLAAYDIFGRPQKHKYPCPALFCLLVYGVYAASYAPEIYAAVPATTGTDNINYQLLLLMILANGIYLLGYGKRAFGDKGRFLNNPRFIMAGAGICLVLAGVSNRAAFDTVAYQSYRLIKTGQAADYKRLAALRTQIMLDDSIRAVVLPAVYDDYSPLKAVSLEDDPENWTNRALRDFYGKDSVAAIAKDEWIEMYGRW